MTALVVNVQGRVRRKRIVFRSVRLVMLVAPVIGTRRAVAIANRIIPLLRLQYRIGEGRWQKLPMNVPRVEVTPE